jgi:5,10-methylenetetrahydromethanopterin reductase
VSLPRLSVRLHGGMTAQSCLEVAKAAERCGFDAVWFAENLFGRGVLPIVGACAAATSRITLGIGVFNPFNRHPTLIAMEIAALDELANGRAALAIGSGVRGLLEQAGINHDKPLGGMRDAIHIVRALLAGETVQYQGRVFSVSKVALNYPPARKPIAIYMAAQGDQALRLTGEIADGVLISNMSPPGYTERALGIMAEGAAKAGRATPRNVLQYVSCVTRPDGDEARRAAAEAVSEFLLRYWKLKERTPLVGEAMMRDSGIPESDFAKAVAAIQAGTPAHAALDERFLSAFAIAGMADECRAGIERFASVGVTELVMTFAGKQPLVDMAYFGQSVR